MHVDLHLVALYADVIAYGIVLFMGSESCSTLEFPDAVIKFS